MFEAVQRYLPFIGRFKRKNNAPVSEETIDGPALTVRRDSMTSGSWCTIQSDGESEIASEKNGQNESIRPKNLIKEAVSLIKRRTGEEYVVNFDISNGREHHKIPAISYRRHDKAPLDFHYVVGHINWETLNKNTSLSKIDHCGCRHDCRKSSCNCSLVNKKDFRYDSKGRLKSSFDLEAPPMIKECNAACACNPKLCKNMVIQRGPKCRVVLFRTRSRGWGIRCLETLKRGTFVGVYSGELLSSSKSTERHDDTYLFNLSNSNLTIEHKKKLIPQTSNEVSGVVSETQLTGANQEEDEVVTRADEEEQYVCDAKFFGNYTRFINHSCNPNVVGIKSFTDHQDYRYPHIAFFTSKDIPSFSELTLNYGDSYWLVKCKRDNVFCLCKQPECRFSKKAFPKTLREHLKTSKTNQ